MRILGYIEHPVMKITVFKTDTRYAVQFEDGLCELTYRYRTDGPLEGFDAIKKLIDPEFLTHVGQQLQQMQAYSDTALVRYMESIANEEDEFDVII